MAIPNQITVTSSSWNFVNERLKSMVYWDFSRGHDGARIWDYVPNLDEEKLLCFIFRFENLSEVFKRNPQTYDFLLKCCIRILTQMKLFIQDWKKFEMKRILRVIPPSYISHIITNTFSKIFKDHASIIQITNYLNSLKKENSLTNPIFSNFEEFNILNPKYDGTFMRELKENFSEMKYCDMVMNQLTVFYFQYFVDTIRILCEFNIERDCICFSKGFEKRHILKNIKVSEPKFSLLYSINNSLRDLNSNVLPTTSFTIGNTQKEGTLTKRIFLFNKPRETIWLRAQRDNHEQVVEDIFGNVQLPWACSQRLKEIMIVILERGSNLIKSGEFKNYADEYLLNNRSKKWKNSIGNFLSSVMSRILNDGKVTYWNSGMKKIICKMFFYVTNDQFIEDLCVSNCVKEIDNSVRQEYSNFFIWDAHWSLNELLTIIVKFIIQIAAEALGMVLKFCKNEMTYSKYDGELDQSQIWQVTQCEESKPLINPSPEEDIEVTEVVEKQAEDNPPEDEDLSFFEKQMKAIEADKEIDEKWKEVARTVLGWNKELREEHALMMKKLEEISK